jgi:hypothetical protein
MRPSTLHRDHLDKLSHLIPAHLLQALKDSKPMVSQGPTLDKCIVVWEHIPNASHWLGHESIVCLAKIPPEDIPLLLASKSCLADRMGRAFPYRDTTLPKHAQSYLATAQYLLSIYLGASQP